MKRLPFCGSFCSVLLASRNRIGSIREFDMPRLELHLPGSLHLIIFSQTVNVFMPWSLILPCDDLLHFQFESMMH